jgi:hypothetical protein
LQPGRLFGSERAEEFCCRLRAEQGEKADRSAQFAHPRVAAGWAPGTPAAVLLGVSRPGSGQWHGTLDTLAADILPVDDGDLPGIIVVGAVAGLAGMLSTELSGHALSADGTTDARRQSR